MAADDGSAARIGLGTALFGLVVLGAGALAGLFAALPIVRWIDGSERLELVSMIIVGLFAPMAAVLLVAAWSLLASVVTQRSQPIIHRGALWALGGVLTVLLGGIAVAGIAEGNWSAVVGAVEGVGLLLLFARYRPTKQKPR